jgi:hypothetical protein
VVFGAIVTLARGIFRQVNATEDNTMAVRELGALVTELKNLYTGLDKRVAVLEDRIKR